MKGIIILIFFALTIQQCFAQSSEKLKADETAKTIFTSTELNGIKEMIQFVSSMISDILKYWNLIIIFTGAMSLTTVLESIWNWIHRFLKLNWRIFFNALIVVILVYLNVLLFLFFYVCYVTFDLFMNLSFNLACQPQLQIFLETNFHYGFETD